MLHDEAVRERAGRAHRQPGHAAGEGGPRSDLSLRLAGRGRCEHSPARCIPTSRCIPRTRRAERRAPDQQRPACAPTRSTMPKGEDTHRLVRAHRRGRGSRLRRRAERVRADEADDRGRRGRRALRGPARRPPRNAATWAARCWCRRSEAVQQARRRAAGRGRSVACPRCYRAHRCRERERCSPRDIDENDKPFLTGERTAEGFFRVSNGHRAGDCRAAWPMRRMPTWSGARPARPDHRGFASQFAEAIHAQFPGKLLAYNCSPSFNWKKKLERHDDRAIPARAGRDGLQVPVHHAGRLPRAQLLRCSSWRAATRRDRMSAYVAAAAGRSSPPRRMATPRPSTSAKSAPAISKRHAGDPGRPLVGHGADGLDRRRAVPRAHPARAGRLIPSG